MSVSEKARLDNIALALRLMMHDLGEPYGWQEHDAIDSHLLEALFGIVDAGWAEDDEMKNYIDIPPRFGLTRL
jgi:hypothetical protein